jgi:hypothetical protein
MRTISEESLRAFHLTGFGLEAYEPRGALRPVPEPARASLRDLYGHALREQRGKARQRFLDQVRYYRDRMEELLELDDRRDPSVAGSARGLLASIG